jgi:large subunit ribosomal protein L9
MPKRKTENATVEVILLESDKHLGEKYEVIRVKPVYARNVLLPKDKAILATPVNKNNYQQKIEAAKHDKIKKRDMIQDLLKKINADAGLTITRKVNKEGSLYAKVGVQDIVNAIKEKYDYSLEDHLLKMKNFDAIGNYTIPVIYDDLKNDIAVHVTAEKQAVQEVDTASETSETQDQ